MIDFYNEESIYLQRQTAGGADVGNRENLLKIVGGTIAWNQLSPVGGGSVTIPAGHVYYFEQTNYVSKYDYDVTVYCDENSVLIDLTIMFGKEIADYVYALEAAQLGDGVAFIKPFIERADKSYNAGELVSVNPSAHETVGFNAWDEEWEAGNFASSTGLPTTDANRIRSKNFISVLQHIDYYGKVPVSANVFLYDEVKNYIGYVNMTNRVFGTGGASFIKFSCGGSTHPIVSYDNDICINISNPSRNGTYEPYVKRTYPIDNIDLRGKLKLDANNKLYYDGDEYAADGTVTRKYELVDMGTLSWQYRSAQQVFTLSVRGFSKTNGNVVCTIYPQHFGTFAGMPDKSIATFATFNANDIIVKDSDYTNAAAFKSAMSGTYLVYERVTEINESAEVWENPQIVDAGGTEEFIDTRDVPMLVSQASMFYQDASIPEAYSSDVIMEIPEQFKRPVVLAFLEAWRAQLREVEDVIGTTREKCGIEGAIGAQLDLFGASIGVMRNGKADEEYRQIIQMKLQTIYGNASPKDVITTLQKFEKITNYSAGNGVMSVEFQHAVDFTKYDVQRTLSPAGVDVNITTVV